MPHACADDRWKRWYPFRSHFLSWQSIRYHYVDEGRGSPLLFVHGNPTWSFLWRRLIERLRPSHRAVAVDHVGCGLSDKPQDYPYTLAVHTQNLIRLVQALDLRGVTLVGHDWGGAIGLGAAVALPDRFARICLMNTGAFPPRYIPFRIRLCRLPLLGPWLVQHGNAFLRAALRMAVVQPRRLTPDIRSGYLAPYPTPASRVAIRRFVQDIPSDKAHPTWDVLAELEMRLRSLRDRAWLLVWGMKDWCFRPECLDRFLEHVPSARVCRVRHAGHWVMEDAADTVASVLEQFLSAP